VLMHPPPSFFAPYPAASPRNSLLMVFLSVGDEPAFRSHAKCDNVV
jgi:hypothetical protein